MEHRRHMWNGRFGRIARRDVFLREDAGVWIVEDRLGGAEGQSRWHEYRSEEQAFDALRDLLGTGDGWRELSS